MDSKQLQQLKELANRFEGLHRLAQSGDYQKYLKPILEDAFNNKWPDPVEAKDAVEFHKQYVEQWARAMAYRDIYNLLASAGKQAEAIAKQIKNPTKDYGIT